jgi:chromosome partitioning protein
MMVRGRVSISGGVMSSKEFWDWFTFDESPLALMAYGLTIGFFIRTVLDPLINPSIAELKARLRSSETELEAKKSSLEECNVERVRYRDRLVNYESVRDALLGEEQQLWRLHPERPPKGYFEALTNSRTKIIAVANHKGGVGKTTITANLAAYFERRLGKRVLAIDLDYQGSLTQTLLRSAGLEPDSGLATDVISGEVTPPQLVQLARTLQPALPKCALVTAGYELYQIENRLMLKWLLEEIDTDIRYHLGQLLFSEEVQTRYDVILIDTPPRLTTAAIDAICAAHHIIVPTVPDRMSVGSVGRFMSHIKELKGRLNPTISLAGVVVNLSKATQLSDTEVDALADVRADLEGLGIQPVIFKQNILRTTYVSGVAGEDIAYLKTSSFREGIMDKLGDEIAQRIGFGVPE